MQRRTPSQESDGNMPADPLQFQLFVNGQIATTTSATAAALKVVDGLRCDENLTAKNSLAAISSTSTISAIENGASSNGDVHHNVDTTRTQKRGQATIFSTVANLVNNLVGAGLLSIPWAMQKSSMTSGFIMLAMIAAMTVGSFVMLVLACDALPKNQPFTFLSLGRQAFGVKFGIAIQFIMFCSTFLSCISYIILSCDFIGGDGGILTHYYPDDKDSFFRNRYFIASVLTVVILLPLAFVRELHTLRYTSAVASISLFFFVFLMAYAFFDDSSRTGEENINRELINSYSKQNPIRTGKMDMNDNDDSDDSEGEDEFKANSAILLASKISSTVSWFGLNAGIFNAEPVLNVAYLCHYNIPRYYSELVVRTPKQMLICSLIAVGLCLGVYVIIGTLGAFIFGCETKSDILESFSPSYMPAILSRVIMIYVVLATYPIVLHSLRESTFSLLQFTPEQQKQRWYPVTILLICATVVPGATLKSIGRVLDFKGAMFGSFIAFILRKLF